MMPTIERLHAVSERVFVNAMRASADNPLAVEPRLYAALQAAGIKKPEDRSRLTEQQLARLLENKTPGQRIEIKHMAARAGIYPRGTVMASSILPPIG